MKETKYEDWVVVFRSSTDYESDLVRDRLGDAGIPAVVLTQRDHAFNLTVGDLAPVNVLVPPDQEVSARTLLESAQFTDEELDAAALAAASAPTEPVSDEEVMLDSGIEKIRLSAPEEADAAPDTDTE